jgi:hypothetical protein
MKETGNNEIDLLLRSLAKRKGTLAEGASGVGAHLDADELNAYAEDVVPPGARQRYTAHLADCDRCRSIATHLVLAVSDKVSLKSEATTPITFRQRLAAFFSPHILRYAVPGLAVLVFIVVGLTVIRQRRESEFIAQRQSEPSVVSRPSDSATTATGQDQKSNAAPAEQTGSQAARSAETNEKPSAEGTVKSGNRPADGSDDSKQQTPRDAPAAAGRPSYAPEVAAAAPPPKPVDSLAREEAAKEKDERTNRASAERQREDKKTLARNEPAATADETRAPASTVNGSRKGPSRSSDEPRSYGVAGRASKVESEAAETRTVNGRTFEHRGSVWVDQAYQPSRAIVNVARGSEQYRALIADEPGLRSIAEALKGEVIVVWKGQAYRIR